MKRSLHHLALLLAMVLLSIAGSGCVEPLASEPEEDWVKLPIRIYLPSPEIATKAETTEPVSGRYKESSVSQLQIWAFTHPVSPMPEGLNLETWDDERPRAFISIESLDEADWQYEEGSAKTLTVYMAIPPSSLNHPVSKLDFYVVGNKNTIDPDNTIAVNMTRGTLKSLCFGNDEGFSTSTDRGNMVTWTSTDPSPNPRPFLPITGFFDNRGQGFDISFLKSSSHLSVKEWEEQGIVWPQIQITRAVSRIQFVFTQAKGLRYNQIHRIELTDYEADAGSQGVIPSKTFLFPREDSSTEKIPSDCTYQTVIWGGDKDAPLITNGAIPEISDPLRLRYDSEALREMSAQYYDDFLQEEVLAGHAVEKILYLRESDKTIKGKIYYSIGFGEEEEAVFYMPGPDPSFYRNHSFTVYAYFIGNHLEVNVAVQDWEKTTLPYEDIRKSINVDQDGRFQIPNHGLEVEVPEGDVGVEGRLVIYAPVGGKLLVRTVPVEGTQSEIDQLFEVTPTEAAIPGTGTDIKGEIKIRVKRKGSTTERKAMKLSFFVQTVEEGDLRTVNADSEIVDDTYTFFIPAATANP